MIIAVWALYVFDVHTFAGQRRVATPRVGSAVPAFARGTMKVVWHACPWNLLVSAVAIAWHAVTPCPVLVAFVAAQLAGIGLLFLWLGSGFGLPRWILIGPLVLGLGLVDAPRLCTALLLPALAGVHVVWVLGIAWPAPSREAMNAYVVGLPEVTVRGWTPCADWPELLDCSDGTTSCRLVGGAARGARAGRRRRGDRAAPRREGPDADLVALAAA